MGRAVEKFQVLCTHCTENAHYVLAAKITHVKASSADGNSSGSSPSIGAGGSGGLGAIMTNAMSSSGSIKVVTSGNNNINTSMSSGAIALTTSQAGASFRAITTGGQSTQVRVVVPPGTLMPQSMIKQLEGAAAAAAASNRTQITAISASGAPRTVSSTGITVSRNVTQATYIPRPGTTAAQMTSVGLASGQRLLGSVRTTTASGLGASVTGLTPAGSFIRGTAVSRNNGSPATTVISAASNPTWMAANNGGQVQLLRAIPHQPRQRLIASQSIGSPNSGGNSPGGTLGQTTGLIGNSQSSNVGQIVASHQTPQQTYVATLATVLPQRNTATLVYSNSVASATQQPSQAPAHAFTPTITSQRFAVAAPLTNVTGANAGARQIRPIALQKAFSTKLNTTSISLRSPNLPQLAPTGSGASSPRSSNITVSTGNIIPTTNLPTTRIIQLQQQPGGGGQQIIGPTGRLASNVMLQPIIVNTAGAGKIAGIRPPVSMAAKVQPSLTITQLGISKLTGGSGLHQAQSQSQQQQQGLTSASGGGSGSASPSIISTSNSPNFSTTNLSHTAILSSTQNAGPPSAGGANTTVVPLAISARTGATGNILAGTITPLKSANSITVGKVMSGAHLSAQQTVEAQSAAGQSGQNAANVFIHQTGAPRAHAVGNNANAATGSVITSGNGAVTSNANAFLPAGSTFYYESVPASSVQVSTGVLSLTTTTVSSSTMSQSQIVPSSSLAINSLPFSNTPASAATFTVVPSTGVRAIGQLQIPVSSNGNTQLQAVPVRFSTQMAHAAANNGANLSEASHITLAPSAQLVSSSGQQLLIPATQQASSAQQHVIIPLQTSIKVATSGNVSSAVVSNILRKRDAEGSPVRAAKNLAPTFLSMNSNLATSVANSQHRALSGLGGAFGTPISHASSNATTAPSASSRSSHAVSPTSSDGSTTVSANSSPGLEQQMADVGNMMNENERGMESNEEMRQFMPINELYSNHHHQMVSSSANEHVFNHAMTTEFANGDGAVDCTPSHKRARRSTNDSQLSMQSQSSFSQVPPPISLNCNILSASATNADNANNTALATGENQYEMNNMISSQQKSQFNDVPLDTTESKENAIPCQFYVKRNRNHNLLQNYKQNSKAAPNHFMRYSDIKPREERKPTVVDLANQPLVLGRINGWKIHHLKAQMEDQCESETADYARLATILAELEAPGSEPNERTIDLLKGNMQRSKIIVDGINEAKTQVMKIFDHKTHVSDIISRCISKRNFKKRDKV